MTDAEAQEQVERLAEARTRIEGELGKVIVGQKAVIEQLLIALLSGGHCLVTGAPGLAKTLLINSLAMVFDLSFRRIQFTPDLMPTDITGTEILRESEGGTRQLDFQPGPIFASLLLADEINRTPPKTQSALLEAMQEKHVTAGGKTRPLPKPFFVLATQNPIEMEGTYPLPEAQLDRFLFNVIMDYLSEDEEVAVITRTTGLLDEKPEPLFTGADVERFHETVRSVPVAEEVARYAVQLSASSRPNQPNSPDFVNEMIEWGAGTRAGQSLILGGKARALLEGRCHVSREDVDALAKPVLRHRVLLNYKAEAEGVTVDEVIERLQERLGS
ncbi:MAG: MoxR family ATPase [Verrucomicrobiota bacterium]